MSKDPFMAATVPTERPPYHAPEDGQSTYVWGGVEYPRVTTILGSATSPRLMMYHAKVAALRAAYSIIASGIYAPPVQPPFACTPSPEYDPWEEEITDARGGFMNEEYWAETMAQLERYVDARAIRVMTPAEAMLDILDWKSIMREPERYRDHKSRIGRLAHHCLYDHALGHRVAESDLLDYLRGLTADLIKWPEELILRYAEKGKDLSHIVDDLCFHAIPHAKNVFAWIEKFQPEWETIGLEAVIINQDEEYAGTMDGIATYQKRHWEAAGRRWDFDQGVNSVRLIDDLKSSNYLHGHVRYQMAAYARADFIGIMADRSEHAIPEVDGMLALHSDPEKGMQTRLWAGAETIDSFFEGFRHLNAFFRSQHDLPKASRSRAYLPPKPKKGERACPW